MSFISPTTRILPLKKLFLKSLSRKSLVLLAVVTGVVGYRWLRPHLPDAVRSSSRPSPTSSTRPHRVASWNLKNFPSKEQDTRHVLDVLRSLDADVIAVQEVRQADLLRSELPDFELHLSEAGGGHEQKLGFLLRRGKVELVGKVGEFDSISHGGRVRPAFHGYLRMLNGGPDFHLLVVHLKARPQGYAIRTTQWTGIQSIVKNIHDETGHTDGSSDYDWLVVGDFNTTGTSEMSAAQERRNVGSIFELAGLSMLEPELDCSAYWDGTKRDAWKEPSLLDLMWARDFGELQQTLVQVSNHCLEYQCSPFRSTTTYPQADYTLASDHCPIYIDVPNIDDD